MPPRSQSQLSSAPRADVSRVEALKDELLYAWDRSDRMLLKSWATSTAGTFGSVLARRISRLAKLAEKIAIEGVASLLAAWQAYGHNELLDYVKERAKAASTSGVLFLGRARDNVSQVAGLLRSNPRDAVPHLLTVVTASLLVSGGPDGDGGAPDLDLMFGIDAHRSIFSHSIIMGSALETAFLSLVELVHLVHDKLPEIHDPFWDVLENEARTLAHGASVGASLGMAYHLAVDGLVQPAAYHDLPVPLPIEAHQSIIVVNGAAEALDAGDKPRRQPVASLSEASPDEQASHRRYLREHFELDAEVSGLLSPSEIGIVEKHGRWMQALADGRIAPLNDAHRQFVDVAAGRTPAVTAHERAWRMYSELVRLGRERSKN